MKIILTVLLFFSLAVHAHDWGTKNIESLNLQLGNWLESYQELQATEDGSKNGFELRPFIGLGLDYKINHHFKLHPELNYVIQETEQDISYNIFVARLDASYLITSSWRFKFGSAIAMHMLSADGGDDTLPNGNSEEVYYIPSERRTSYVQTIDLGIDYLAKPYIIRFESLIYHLRKSEKRSFTYTLSFLYQLDWEKLF